VIAATRGTVGADEPLDWRPLALLVAVLALVASVVGLPNGFAYDDRWIIVENARAHALRAPWEFFQETYWPNARGAALYRPLAILMYSLQWVVGQGRPMLFHAVNIALYLALSVAVLRVALHLLPRIPALVVGMLFAVHPVHVEAVGNVVGQAELWTALTMVGAVALYLRDRRDGLPLTRAGALGVAGLYVVGMCFKEHAIVLPGILAAAECTVVRDPRPWRVRLDECVAFLLRLALLATLFLAARTSVLRDVAGDVPHPALQGLGMGERSLVMLGLVPEIGRLLIWPARLYADYSPQQVHAHTGWHVELLPGVLLIVCTLMLATICVRRAPLVSFGIAWIVVSLVPVANILLPTGILIAERTLLLPSIGAVLIVGAGALWALRRLTSAPRVARVLAVGALTILVGAGAAHSAERQRTWKDNDAVFETLARDAPRNFRSHYSLGGRLFEQHRPLEAEREWRLAIALLPGYHGVRMDLAHKYREAHVCQAAVPEYRRALEIDPDQPLGRAGLVACQLELRQWRAARTEARIAIAGGFYRRAFDYMIEVADSALVATDSADATVRWAGKHSVRKP
jgi:hypothetical protein